MNPKNTFIVELLGLPRTGKTTISRILSKTLIEKGFNPHIISERASVCPVKDKLDPMFNLWTCNAFLKEYIEARENGHDVVIADRGVMDAAVWVEAFREHRCFEMTEQLVRSFLKSKILNHNLLCGYYLHANVATVIEREELHLSKPRRGRILNEKTLMLYLEAFDIAKQNFDSPFIQLDTTLINISETVSAIESDLMPRLFSKINIQQ